MNLERKIVSILETIINKEIMETLYFRADLYNLTQIMSKYKEEEEVLTFYKNLDYLSKRKDKIFLFELERRQCLNCLEFCGKFLLELFMESTIGCIEEMPNTDIGLDMLKSLYTNFGELLKTKVSISGKEYKILKERKINQIISCYIKEQRAKTLSKKVS